MRIVGYIGERDATPIILNGLKRLEYRGYDSAGIAVLQDGHIELRRDAGKFAQAERPGGIAADHGKMGIGHTRWATHGEPNARNAHPHMGMTGEVVVVHNGIVENFLELREELTAEGVVFNSDTDTEVIVHLIERSMSGGTSLAEAARKALRHLKGAHGIVVLSSREPDKIVAARIGNAGGVVIGFGEGENVRRLRHARHPRAHPPGGLPGIAPDGSGHPAGRARSQTLEGQPLPTQVHTVAWDPVAAEKGEYRHFMQKEIHEQVRSLTDTIAGRVDFENGQGIRLPRAAT